MVIRVKALHALVPKQDYEAWHLDAYSYAGRACAAHVRLWATSQHLSSVPSLVFAKGDTGRDDLEKALSRDDFTDFVFKPAKDEKNRKTGFIEKAAIPLQAADLFAYELFYPIRKIESGIHGHQLTPIHYFLDKIPGEAQVTEDKSLLEFNERMQHWSGSVGPGVVLAKWMPK